MGKRFAERTNCSLAAAIPAGREVRACNYGKSAWSASIRKSPAATALSSPGWALVRSSGGRSIPERRRSASRREPVAATGRNAVCRRGHMQRCGRTGLAAPSDPIGIGAMICAARQNLSLLKGAETCHVKRTVIRQRNAFLFSSAVMFLLRLR